MCFTVDAILEPLRDGMWHPLTVVSRVFSVSEAWVREAMEFLARFGFVDVDHTGGKVRLNPVFSKFLRDQ